MRLLILITLMASVLTAQAPTPAPNAAPRGNVENGKKLFATYGCYHATAMRLMAGPTVTRYAGARG